MRKMRRWMRHLASFGLAAFGVAMGLDGSVRVIKGEMEEDEDATKQVVIFFLVAAALLQIPTLRRIWR